jgi:hypothetical protein
MPWDVGAANDEALAGKKYANAASTLDSSWLRTQQDYGLEGPWADVASNPYSRAAAFQRSYDNARRGTTNSAGRNLYAGSYINAQNQNTRQMNIGRDDLQKSYAQANAQHVAEKQEAQNRYQEELNQAAWERVNAGLGSEPEPMPTGGGGGKPGKKPKKPAANRQQAIARNIAVGRKRR